MSIPPRQAQAPWHVIGGLHQLHHLLFSEPAALMDEVEAVVGLAVGTQGGLGDLALLYVDLSRVPADKALDVFQEEDLVDDHIKGGDDLLGVGNKLLVQVLIELLDVDAVDGQEGLLHCGDFSPAAGGSTALRHPCSQESCNPHCRGLQTSGQIWPSWPCTG